LRRAGTHVGGREADIAESIALTINGEPRRVVAERDEPLLYVLADRLEMRGAKFGCGLAQCGACSVLVDGVEVRSCVHPTIAARGREVVTPEGLGTWYARRGGQVEGDPPLHPVQSALIELQAAQCGYCYGGIAVKAAELLAANPAPSEAEIVEAMDGHLCRCGTYPRIVAAIRRAAEAMRA
jgi:aerobic-type carbon monoxide dehydrogenase small subunit (CoxS/CutS family)